MQETVKTTSFDFLKNRMIALVIFVVLSVAGLATYFQKGFILGTDFSGGIRIEFTSPLSIEELRTRINNDSISITTLRNNAGEESFLLTAPAELGQEGSGDHLLDSIRNEEQPEEVQVISSEYVGPSVGNDFANQSLRLLLTVAVLILIYVAFRFDFVYGIGAIAALFHDMWILLIAVLILRIPIDLTVLAAFLTILGYSINDTIVIFDRIRENHDLAPTDNYYYLINKSINHSLSRTILTSVTTLFVALSIYIWAGNSLKNFGLLLSIGILCGTYSSLFIACPTTYSIWTRKQQAQK